MKDRIRFVDSATPTKEEMAKVENEANKAVKAALLISGADKQRYRELTDKLANNYLFGTDQYPNTYKKAMRILGNYQMSRNMMPYHTSPNNTRVAFCQRGGRGGAVGKVDRESSESRRTGIVQALTRETM